MCPEEEGAGVGDRDGVRENGVMEEGGSVVVTSEGGKGKGKGGKDCDRRWGVVWYSVYSTTLLLLLYYLLL